MSNLIEYAKNISPSLYDQLKRATETGKWPDGNKLSHEQQGHTLQLIMAYQSLYNQAPDHFSIAKGGEIYLQKKDELRVKFVTPDDKDIHLIDL